MASKHTEADDLDDDFLSNTDIQRDSVFSSITPFSRGNQSGRSIRGDLNDENPHITLPSLMSKYPKSQTYGERGKSLDREFDNGYSYKARDITDNSNDSKKPVMQLLEKKSARTPTYLRGVWNEEKIELVKKGETVIQNTFTDFEDGENGTNHPEMGKLSTERANINAYDPDIKTGGNKQLEELESLIFCKNPNSLCKDSNCLVCRNKIKDGKHQRQISKQNSSPDTPLKNQPKSVKSCDSSGSRSTEANPNQSRVPCEKFDVSNQPVVEQYGRCVRDEPKSLEGFDNSNSTENSRIFPKPEKGVHRNNSNKVGVDINDNMQEKKSDDIPSVLESKERKLRSPNTRDTLLTDTMRKPGELSTKSWEFKADKANKLLKDENKQHGVSAKALHQRPVKDSITDEISSEVKQQTLNLLDLLNESKDEGGINYFLCDDDEEDGYLGLTSDSLSTEVLEGASKKLSSQGYATHDGRYSKGRNQTYNMPTFYHSIRKFAEDNGFETIDSKHDGNCMFEAVADQLVVNGEFGLTIQDIRSQAVHNIFTRSKITFIVGGFVRVLRLQLLQVNIGANGTEDCADCRYLRENPFHNDGSHLESFLSTESWDMYLQRMERNYQWGDHLILTAIASALKLHIFVFNVYEDDIRQTEIEPNNSEKKGLLPIYLGHIGEFHYMSLRRTNWEHFWPYKALIRRIHYCCPQESSEKIQQKIKQMGIKKYIEDAGILSQDSSHCAQGAGVVQDISTDGLPHSRVKFNTYGLKSLQLEETEESLETLVSDERYIDVITGLPIPHLSYVIRQLLYANFIIPYETKIKPEESKVFGVNLRTEFKGPMFENSNFALLDFSKTKSMSKFNNLQQYNKPIVIYTYMDTVIGYSSHEYSILDTKADAFADSTMVQPGFCRLRPSVLRHRDWGKENVRIGSDTFIQGVHFPTDVFDSMKNQLKKAIFGINCLTFPPCTQEWQCRKRPSNWPSVEILEEVMASGCVLIHSAHPQSKCPTVEWKYEFFRADQIIFNKGLTQSQMQVFRWYKLMTMYMTRHLERPLKNRHIKSVFFYACEIIPVEAWQTKAGACLLYLFGSLRRFLKRKNIPHYFISSCNMLDDYSTEQVETIETYVEAFRAFPMMSLQFIMNRYGYGKGNVMKLSSSVLRDSQRFATDYDLTRVILHVFIPTSIRRVRRLAKLEFYEAAYKVIKDAHEELLSIQRYAAGQSGFKDFFRYVLNKIKDQTNCQELISMFENETGVTVSGIHVEQICLKDLVPWKLEDSIGNMWVPEPHRKDLVSVAKFLDNSAFSHFIKLDLTRALLLVETAVKIIQSLLLDNSVNPNEIVDRELKSVVRNQTESLIYTLKYMYSHLFIVCNSRINYEPLREHISELEKINQQHPSVSGLIRDIQYYLNYGSQKQREDYSNAKYNLELD